MKKRALIIVLALALILTGCQSAIPVTVNDAEFAPSGSLPPPEPVGNPPTGDAQMSYYGMATLYLPRKDGARLIAKYSQIAFSAARHEAENVVRALLAFPETEDSLSLGQGTTLQLTGNTPVEVSHDVCTVNLAPSSLALDAENFFTLCQAIANTVTEFQDIKYVNILVGGRPIGLDIASMLPLGTLQRRLGEDLNALYSRIDVQRVKYDESHAQKRFTAMATLYFPASVGNGVLPEARTLTFPGQTAEQLAQKLIEELSLGPQLLPSMPALPNITAFLATTPQIMQAQTGEKTMSLKFSASLNEALAESTITRSALMASLTYTLTTFIPELTGIRVTIGDEFVTSVTPVSIYASSEPIHFADGVQKRADYSRLLLGLATLYFASEDGQRLMAVSRPVPYYEVRSPRYLLGQLALGPRAYDDLTAVMAVMPPSVRDPDFLGFAVMDETVFVNLSQAFQDACQGYNEQQERLLIYAAVNTLCGATGFKRVRLFIADEQPDSLAGSLYLPGEFLQNSGIVRAR